MFHMSIHLCSSILPVSMIKIVILLGGVIIFGNTLDFGEYQMAVYEKRVQKISHSSKGESGTFPPVVLHDRVVII